MQVAHTRSELGAALSGLRRPLGLVPTMGALHGGHEALMVDAARRCPAVAVSIFVNPLQFGPAEDLDRYPRSLDDDLARCDKAGVDLVWAPAVSDVYPDGLPRVRVDPGPLGDTLEGAVRPGHFAGALTVVAKLLNLVRPDSAYFGEKDYQQLVLVRRMVRDLEFGLEITGIPTVREPDGLALSSRNRNLSADERERALSLSRALLAGRAATGEGPGAVLDAAAAELNGVDLDYLELRAADLGAAPSSGAARLLVAARFGTTRLIDNVAVEL
jgi:pantoate--beta-alanine ligase